MDVAGLRILHYPAQDLRRVAKPIAVVDETVAAVAARMLELTKEAEGAGLAAPQVGVSWRMFVTRGPEGEPDRVLINPRITQLRGELIVAEEGCLSLPGIHVDVRRARSATLKAMDLDGGSVVLSADDLVARIWQHECDHLDGVLIIDKMAPIDRLATRKQLKELESASNQ